MNKKIALIFGITGQDGSYLAEFLLKKNTSSMVSKEDHLQLIPQELTIFIKNQGRNLVIFFFIMEISPTPHQYLKLLSLSNQMKFII